MRNEPKIYEKGLVSVVTPVFNGEKYISRLLRSVLEQTYPHVEMILVDDGSEDHTVLVAESYREQFARKGWRYEIVRASHKNASAALNRGLPLVRGEYLVWPDGDDRLTPESIEVRVRFLLENPAYSCVRSLSSYFDDKTGLPMEAQERRGDLTNEELFWDVLEVRTFVCCGCYMLKSQQFFEIYPDRKIPEYDVGQNFQMLLPFLYRHKCPTLRQELYEVAVREGSSSRRVLTEEEKAARCKGFERLVDDIAAICEIRDMASKRRLWWWKLQRRLVLVRDAEKRYQAIKMLWRA